MKNIRILYSAEKEELDLLDLCVSPTALVGADSFSNREFLKPIDFLSPQEVREIKGWTFDMIISLDQQWRKSETQFPEFIAMIGGEISILLEYIKVADIVLNKVISSYKGTAFNIGLYSDSCNMIQYEGGNYAYIELLKDPDWIKKRNLKVVVDEKINAKKDSLHYSRGFSPAKWKTTARLFLAFLRIMFRLQVDPFSLMLMKCNILPPRRPELLLSYHKDSKFMLRSERSISVHDYLLLIPGVSKKQVNKLRSELGDSLNKLFSLDGIELEGLRPYKNIILNKLVRFMDKRVDLLESYLKFKNIGSNIPKKMILESALGVGVDAWCSVVINEQGGQVASAQHGGGYGNANIPMQIFTDYRFSHFFSYGDPFISPQNERVSKHGVAKRIVAGSPILYQIREKCIKTPIEIKRILYVMNLCVPFYSVNFPWEHILEQIKILHILEKYSEKYSIDVKIDHSGAIDSSSYKGLNFIAKSPREVMHEYDLIVLESSISTAVLEAAVTKCYVALFTGVEWEDVCSISLEMLSKRVECFNTWKNFQNGLNKILENPLESLSHKKLKSQEFVNLYCNPVPVNQYINTLKASLNL